MGVHLVCQLGGLAVVLNGVVGVLDIFDVFDHAIYYIMNCYAVFFGVVTCITESHPQNNPASIYETFKGLQEWMHEWAKGLTMLVGRGLFYIFQGVLAIVSSGYISLGILIGVYMIVVGIVCISVHIKDSYACRQDYIRVDP